MQEGILMSASNGNRHDTPAYALASEVESVRAYATQTAHHTWRNTARVEHLENLLNGIEERLATRTGAQLDLHLGAVAREHHALRAEVHAMRDDQRRENDALRAAIFEAIGVAKGAEKDARHAIREAEMASGTNEITGQFAQLAADEKRADLKAKEERRAIVFKTLKTIVAGLVSVGGAGALIAAIMQSCGG